MISENLCLFTVRVANPPRFNHVGEKKVPVVNLRCSTSYQRNNDSKPEISYHDFEAWAEAAEILKNAAVGDILFLKCSARMNSWEKDGQKQSRTVFRINSFQVFESDTIFLDGEQSSEYEPLELQTT